MRSMEKRRFLKSEMIAVTVYFFYITMLCCSPDATVKGARSERHPLAHIAHQKVSFYFSVQCNICHGEDVHILSSSQQFTHITFTY